MPNIRRQIVGPLDDLGAPWIGKTGFHIQASDGSSFTIAKEDVLGLYVAAVSIGPAKKDAAIAALKTQIGAALPAALVDPASLVLDFDTADGTPLLLQAS